MPSSDIFLGNEVIIISVEDAREVLRAILAESDQARLKRLEDLGYLYVVENLRKAIRRHDEEMGDD